MTDRVQKIKEWISKTQDGLMDANGNFEYTEHEGAYHILCNLDAYIDSLQEEPNLEGVEKEVAEGYVARINRKRIPIELKGEIKAKFKNEFHTIWQIVNGMQFANVAKYIIERICLHFATWGAYHLKDYIGMSDKEKAKMDSLQEEPVSDDLWEASKQYALRQVFASTDEEMSEQAYLDLRLFSGLELAVAHKDGANWQKQKDKSKVLTEEQCRKIRDDAFELGKDAMKQKLMAKAVDVTIAIPYHNGYGGYTQLVDSKEGLPFGENLKVFVIKED